MCGLLYVCIRDIMCGLVFVRVCLALYVYISICRYVSTGWRRLIGSSKFQIIFHKRATEYRSLLRKMTYKDKGSYEYTQEVMKDQGFQACHTCEYETIHM